jgi:hypothetical protein
VITVRTSGRAEPGSRVVFTDRTADAVVIRGG